jgi:hypothetical protein
MGHSRAGSQIVWTMVTLGELSDDIGIGSAFWLAFRKRRWKSNLYLYFCIAGMALGAWLIILGSIFR